MRNLAVALLFASAAFAQDVDRAFHLTNAKTAASLNEIATTLRTAAQIQQLSIDPALATMTVQGSRDQIALAEWLVPKLDVAPGANSGPQSYRIAGSDDVVMVFTLAHTPTSRGCSGDHHQHPHGRGFPENLSNDRAQDHHFALHDE